MILTSLVHLAAFVLFYRGNFTPSYHPEKQQKTQTCMQLAIEETYNQQAKFMM